MFCCTLLNGHSSIAVNLMGKRELVALLNLSSWCLLMVERLFLAVPRGCLRFVIVVFPDHTHLIFFITLNVDFLNKLLNISESKSPFVKQSIISFVYVTYMDIVRHKVISITVDNISK